MLFRSIKQFVLDLNKKEKVAEAVHYTASVEDVEVDVAMMYNSTYSEIFYSFVNNIKTIDGGTHESGFRAGLTRAITNYISLNAGAREKDAKITGDDVREGLIAIVSVKVPEPQFEGQTKGKLGSSYVKPIVQKLVYEFHHNCTCNRNFLMFVQEPAICRIHFQIHPDNL